MQLMKILPRSITIISLALFSGMAYGFSFDFGDNDDYPGWIRGYGQPAPRYYYYPQMNSFDRSRMVERRQARMEGLASKMNRLSDLLSGRYGFDRAEAIWLARSIEGSAGYALTQYFHPGAVIDHDSHTTTSLWGNEQMFKANAMAVKQAAKELAEELEKTPKADQGAVMLRARRKQGDEEDKTVAVSPKIWEKYNRLSDSCNSCHYSFRSPIY